MNHLALKKKKILYSDDVVYVSNLGPGCNTCCPYNYVVGFKKTIQGRRQLFGVRGLTYKLLIIHEHLCIFSADIVVMTMATSLILHWVII